MKVLQILTELGPGGAERVALDLSAGLLARGHSVSVISLKPPPANRTIPDAFISLGIVPEYLYMDGIRDIFRFFRLRKRIRELSPDVVHSHLMHPNLLSRLACIGLKKRLLNTVHISERRTNRGIFFFLDRLTFPLCSACNAVSFASAAFQEEKLGLKKGTVKVVYNGVDAVPRPEAAVLERRKEEWGLAGCSRIAGCLGRLDPQKGFDLFLRLLPALSARVPEGETGGIVILGEGTERSRLEALAAETPPNLKVVLPGFYADAKQMIWMFDCFVMPSRYEGYGLVLAEAMSTGAPVVVNPVDSLPELCRFYPNSVLSDFNRTETADAVAEALFRGRIEPRLISSKKEMTGQYVKLYKDL